MNNSSRAGQYIRQPGGYSAFIPAALPPQPPINFDAELLTLLSQADRALAVLHGAMQTLPHANDFMAMCMRREAVLSCRIDGVESRVDDLVRHEAGFAIGDEFAEYDEALNYLQAMRQGDAAVVKGPVTTALIRQLHRLLLHGMDEQKNCAGELRQQQTWIGRPGCSIVEATFVPAPPRHLNDLLRLLQGFLYDESLPVLIQVGLAHAQFETIHPFLSKNGRVGRLLIGLLLHQKDLLQLPVLTLSDYFREHRQAYYGHLQRIRETGDWEGWLKFFLNGVLQSSQHVTETAIRSMALRERHRERIIDEFGRVAANGMRVLESLYQRPFIRVQDLVDMSGLTFQASNNLMNKFIAHGILSEATGQARNRLFCYDAYIELFE
ncbi:MAG: Fic/DOC family N-terminal domain-containing protein [Pseudomonadota bacterium]|nr:Fic/DOC family N-terminal domain-containing protein [Pseudomonadota bacterium]